MISTLTYPLVGCLCKMKKWDTSSGPALLVIVDPVNTNGKLGSKLIVICFAVLLLIDQKETAFRERLSFVNNKD